MKKTFKKFLSLLLICSMIFTTHSFTTFADALDNEETVIETTIEETETTTVIENEEGNVGVSLRARDEEETSTDEVSEPDLESTEYVEEPELDETTIKPANKSQVFLL